MSTAGTATSPDAIAFGGSQACFEQIVGWLEGTDTGSLTHGELEDGLDRRGRELFQDAVDAIGRGTGVSAGKRQTEDLAARAAAHVEGFYATRQHAPVNEDDVLVISADGKGIVMRPDSLRPATAAKAATATSKLETRLSKGEKRNHKRLAEVGAVYDLTPRPRSAMEIMNTQNHDQALPAPETKNKWLTTSVVNDAAEVVNHQIERISTEAAIRSVTVTIVVDFIHVLEYLWDAAWCFYTEGHPAAEKWVHDRAIAILEGRANQVAAGIRRRATSPGLSATMRKNADQAATYLANKAPYLDYPTALAAGWQIATGMIEGACRHLVKDRMDITGARWSAPRAEAVLKLRAVRMPEGSNGGRGSKGTVL